MASVCTWGEPNLVVDRVPTDPFSQRWAAMPTHGYAVHEVSVLSDSSAPSPPTAGFYGRVGPYGDDHCRPAVRANKVEEFG